MARHAQLDDEIVHQLLRALFGEDAVGDIALDINIEEGAHAAEGHGRAVLLLDGGEIGEVRPLDGLAGVGGGFGNVITVFLGDILEVAQEVDLLVELLAQAGGFGIERAFGQSGLVLFLFGDELIHAVERNAAIVADDAAAAVGVRQAGDDMAAAGEAHFIGIGAEDAVVMGGAVAEFVFHLLTELIAVGFARLLDHAHAAEGVHAPLERAVGLQADDDLVGLVDIAGGGAGDEGRGGRVDIEHAAVLPFQREKVLHLFHEGVGALGRAGQEGAVAGIFGIVGLDKIANVDLILPCAAFEAGPIAVFHI